MGLDMKNVGTLCESVPAGKAICFTLHPARQEIITLSKPLSYLAPLVLPEKRISFGDVILYDFGFRISYND